MSHWLLKSEPESYSWDDLVRDGGTEWDGVRNNAAAAHLRAMRPGGAAGKGGAVVNIASVAATIAFPAIAGYSATKSAVDRLTRVAAMEAGKLGYGVRVNCVYPGLVPTEMGMKLADYQELLGKVRGTQLVCLEDMSGDDDDDYLDRHVASEAHNPLALLQDHRMRVALVEAIKNLPEREQYVMSMYYEHDMNLKEIAAVIGVTESRVCQLHSQSIARLRAKLREW